MPLFSLAAITPGSAAVLAAAPVAVVAFIVWQALRAGRRPADRAR